jgi:hypothetical protein
MIQPENPTYGANLRDNKKPITGFQAEMGFLDKRT